MRIYLSSTYVDLLKHRQAVAHVLRQMGHDVVAMEEYVAEGARPIERCLADVRRADLYVGIFAWRYGHVPTNGPADPTKLPNGTSLGQTSITEFEWRCAKEGHRLAFLLDPQAEWPAHLIDAVDGNNEKAQKIADLRAELAGSELVAFFKTPEDLARQVAAAVHLHELRSRLQRIAMMLSDTSNLGGFGNDVYSSVNENTSNLMALSKIGTDADVVVVDLGGGQNWWSTRLYLLAEIMANQEAGRAVLFTDSVQPAGNKSPLAENEAPECSARFVGIVPTEILRRQMLTVHPQFSALNTPEPSQLAQAAVPPAIPYLPTGLEQRLAKWQEVVNTAVPGGERAMALPVTRRRMRDWLRDYLVSYAVEEEDGAVPSALFLRQVLEYPGPYVPTVHPGRAFKRVIPRAALVDQLAHMFVTDLAALRY